MLIQKKRYSVSKWWLSVPVCLALGCMTGGPDSTDRIPTHGAVAARDVEAEHRFGLIGREPAYLVQAPESVADGEWPLIAEVSLWKDGANLTQAYVYDGEVTGESVYTVVAEHLALRRLRAPHRLPEDGIPGFTAELHRGYERGTGDSFMSGVTFKVRRVIRPVGLGPLNAVCPWTVFGNSQEMFAMESQPLPGSEAQVVKLRIRTRTLNQAQAEQIKGGVCARLNGLDGNPLKPHMTYDFMSDLFGKPTFLTIEVLERLPFRLPRSRS